jgi:hypothetical protein
MESNLQKKKMHKMNPLTVYDPIGSSRAIANKNLKSTENVLPYFIYLKSVDFVYIWIKILTGLFLSRKIKKIKFVRINL